MPKKTCEFEENWWNDPEQRNYLLYECHNPKNAGGRASTFEDGLSNYHSSRTYSCWHKNEGMTYRCFGDSKKITNCPLINQSE